MKDFHVIMPVDGFVKITERFNSVLTFLQERKATIHLTCQVNTPLTIYEDSERLKSQQTQMRKMGIMLKHEMLDRIAQKIQANYPALKFQYHVEGTPLHEAVSKLEDAFDIQLLVVDQQQIANTCEERTFGTFHHLLNTTNTPLWCVGNKPNSSGNIVVGIDLPVHNLQHEQLNRLMVHTANQLANEFDSHVTLTHCWQLSSQEFMRRWLKLTDIDVARFSRVEKQQHEAHLLEYVEQTRAKNTEFTISILEGDANVLLPKLCREDNAHLMIIGHDQNPYGTMGHTTISLLLNTESDALILPYTPFAQSSFLHFIESGLGKPTAQKEARVLPVFYQASESGRELWKREGV